MSADLAMTPVLHPAMPAALMLLLSLGVSTLAAYVSLDLARRVRVLWTRAGLLWLLGAAIVACAAGRGAVSGRVATPTRLAFGAFALGTGVVGAHALALAPLGLQPGIIWRLLPLIAAIAGASGGCMMGLGAFFRGGDRTRPATLPWQLTAALVLGATLVVSEQLVI